MTLRGASLAIAGSLALAGVAGAQITASPQLNRQFAVAPKVEEEAAPPITFTKMSLKFAPVVALKAMTPEKFAEAMKGWSPLTEGSVIGSPELYSEEGQVYLIATGPDNKMHGGRINISTMAVEPSSWTVFNTHHKSSGNVACAAQYNSIAAPSYNEGCYFLDTEGGGVTLFMHPNNGVLGGTAVNKAEGKLGKSVAFAQLTIDKKKAVSGYDPAVRFGELVWDGSKLWFSQAAYLEWGVIAAEGAVTGLGCDHFCAYRRADGSAVYVSPHTEILRTVPRKPTDPTNKDYEVTSKGSLRQIGEPTPPLPGAYSQPEVVETKRLTRIFMGRQDGRLSYIAGQTDKDPVGGVPTWGSWQDLGGAMASDSAPSCTPYSQGGVCAIKAIDGRIYARTFNISKGL